jgi:CBS domain containing-hemolysin-like protein
MSIPLFWLLLNIASIVVLSFYSMMEMACVSFNKIRLQYYLSEGDPHAYRLNYLLHKPERLFGTTLLGVNVAMIFGSEFARQFHSSIGVNPDWAPLSQVMIVVIFGELAPMFAARRYAEHVAMLGIDLLYVSAKIMTPILWLVGCVTYLVHFFIGNSKKEHNIFLSQEELKKILEAREEEGAATGFTPELNKIVSNIFTLSSKKASHVMTPLEKIFKVPSNCTIAEMRHMLKNTRQSFLPVYHRTMNYIVGIAFPRDLLRVPDNQRVRDHARQPWFITKKTEIVQILKQFRFNKQEVAVVLNEKGEVVGILTLDDIVEEIFGHADGFNQTLGTVPLIERTFSADTSVEAFNKMYGVSLDSQGVETLGELVVKVLGHHPTEGESVFIAPFEFKVKEATIMDIKSITIKTHL